MFLMKKFRAVGMACAAAAGIMIAGAGVAAAADGGTGTGTDNPATGSSSILTELVKALATGSSKAGGTGGTGQ